MMTNFERKTYFENEDIKVYLEHINEQVWVHVGIFNMNKAVLNKIKEQWGEVAIKTYLAGYETLYAYTKDNRIIKLIGGAELIGEHEGYEVYKWDLN
jgi:hypothetical protein